MYRDTRVSSAYHSLVWQTMTRSHRQVLGLSSSPLLSAQSCIPKTHTYQLLATLSSSIPRHLNESRVTCNFSVNTRAIYNNATDAWRAIERLGVIPSIIPRLSYILIGCINVNITSCHWWLHFGHGVLLSRDIKSVYWRNWNWRNAVVFFKHFLRVSLKYSFYIHKLRSRTFLTIWSSLMSWKESMTA